MKTLTEKYNAIKRGEYSKSQFLRDIRLSHPGYVNQFTSYEDAIQILKGKSLLYETYEPSPTLRKTYSADEVLQMAGVAGTFIVDAEDALKDLVVSFGEQIPEEEVLSTLGNFDLDIQDVVEIPSTSSYSHPTDGSPEDLDMPSWMRESTEKDKNLNVNFPPSLIDKALKLELDLVKKEGTEFTPEDYDKARQLVLKNLQKTRNYYDRAILGYSDFRKKEPLQKGNNMEPVSKTNTVDKVNGMSKVPVRENFKPEYYHYYNRMEGLSNVKALDAVKKGSAILLRELTDEGFEEEEVLDFLITQIKTNYGITAETVKTETDALQEQKILGNREQSTLKEAVKTVIKKVLQESTEPVIKEDTGSLDLRFIKKVYLAVITELKNTGDSFESVFPRPGDFMHFVHNLYYAEKAEPSKTDIAPMESNTGLEKTSSRTVGDYLRELKNKRINQ